MRIKNKERFETFLAVIGFTVMLIIALATPFKKPVVMQYHEYIEQGHTYAEWCEYMEVNG